jgi:hypothetical protein
MYAYGKQGKMRTVERGGEVSALAFNWLFLG